MRNRTRLRSESESRSLSRPRPGQGSRMNRRPGVAPAVARQSRTSSLGPWRKHRPLQAASLAVTICKQGNSRVHVGRAQPKFSGVLEQQDGDPLPEAAVDRGRSRFGAAGHTELRNRQEPTDRSGDRRLGDFEISSHVNAVTPAASAETAGSRRAVAGSPLLRPRRISRRRTGRPRL